MKAGPYRSAGEHDTCSAREDDCDYNHEQEHEDKLRVHAIDEMVCNQHACDSKAIGLAPLREDAREACGFFSSTFTQLVEDFASERKRRGRTVPGRALLVSWVDLSSGCDGTTSTGRGECRTMFRDAAHEQKFQARPSMGCRDDQVDIPLLRKGARF